MGKTKKMIMPTENVEYTIRMPETGNVVTLRFSRINEKDRVEMVNVRYGSFVDFSRARISYLLCKSLISKKAIEQPKAPAVEKTAPKLDKTPVVADSDAEKQFLKMIDKVAGATGTAASEILRKTGYTPAAIAQKVKTAFNSDTVTDAEFGKYVSLINKAYDILHPFGVAI